MIFPTGLKLVKGSLSGTKIFLSIENPEDVSSVINKNNQYSRGANTF